MTPQEMHALAAGLGEAKSRQDVRDALRFLRGDMPPYSPEHRNREEGHT